MPVQRLTVVCVVVLAAGALAAAQQGDVNDQIEKAVKEAARKVGPSIVQIQTQGGADMVVTSPKGPVFRKALGPTTGVVVAPDGYIISSAFNFLNNPTTIVVLVPGQKEPVLAKKVATDKSRMLTLLKIDTAGLPVPDFVPKRELLVGQSALAMGRTLVDLKSPELKRDQPPSVSHGIISALGRIWGKAIQTDAKVSPINYGGPLVDLAGRVQGILIPASPTGDEITAGFEWYDSGIGFAVPMEDVFAAVPRLKTGKDLEKAVLGIKLKGKNQYGAAPEVAVVQPESAAEKAGLKPGDILIGIDDKTIASTAQMQHALGPKYEGDVISLKWRRGKEEMTASEVKLTAAIKQQFQTAYLGILPMRDDPRPGVEVRYVFPKSPAEAAGIKAGDRIVKFGQSKNKLSAFKTDQRGREQLADFLDTHKAGDEIALVIEPKAAAPEGEAKAKDPIVIKLAGMPGSSAGSNDDVPETLPAKASLGKALEPMVGAKVDPKAPKDDKEPKKAETGLVKRTNASGDRRYWIYVPKDYNPQVAHGIVVWLHTPGKFSDDDVEKTTDLWEDACKEQSLIVVGPLTEQEGGWTPSDADLVQEAVRDVIGNYTIDRTRIIAHGMANGGQMAFNLAFRGRELFRGAAAVGAVMNEPQDNAPGQRLSFYVACGDRDPVVKAVSQTRQRLVAHRYPVYYREFPNRGREYLTAEAFAELVRWVDMLDRL
jgi:serine protease Do